MEIRETPLKGLLVIEPKYHRDPRGFFVELWHETRYGKAGVSTKFVQDNVSFSSRGVLRGLHFQKPNAQGKLLTCLQGEIFDVAVDIRVGSPTFGKWYGVSLTSENGWQFWVPEGFAHGFCVVSEKAMVSYKCTELYHPESEASVLWNDPEIGIRWPQVPEYSLSEKDKRGLPLKDFPSTRLPSYT
jgi:dTDP-4-dehydrorhamnose 3,5-epimerase